MSTAPFQTDTESIIAESHRQIVRARATHPSLVGALELALQDISLEWDEQRTPRVTADLTVKIPDTLSDLSILDPRTGVRIEIDCGYIRPGGEEDVQTIADLGLRDVGLNRPDNTMRLVAASDEMMCIDASPAVKGSIVGTSHADAISQLIKACISPAPKITASVTGAAVTIDPVTDRWDTMNDVADRIGAKVYDNGLREFFIAAAPVLAVTPDLTLTVGSGGTVLTSQSKVSRDDWFNYVLIRYVWKNTSGVEQEISTTAYMDTGNFAITGPAGKRIYFEEREVPTTQAVANAASAAILNRFLARTKTYSIETIAAYWLRPGMTISLKLPEDTVANKYLVQRVAFNPLRGTMAIQTRLSESTTSFATTTPTGGTVTDPVPAAKQTYVSEWVASSSQAYKGDGSKRTDIPTEFSQGYYSSTNGNQRSILLFTSANSTGDETGKTITQALTGATLIKAEIVAYANHWYYADGGTARIGFYNGTTIPTTFSSDNAYVTQTGWARNSTRTVNISSSSFFSALGAGTARGVTFGPGSGTNREYYGKFNGATATSNKPRLRLTYSK